MSSDITKQLLTNTILFFTFTGITHYIVSKYILNTTNDDDDTDKNDILMEEVENNEKTNNKKIINKQEIKLKLLEKKKELTHLYDKITEINTLLNTFESTDKKI